MLFYSCFAINNMQHNILSKFVLFFVQQSVAFFAVITKQIKSSPLRFKLPLKITNVYSDIIILRMGSVVLCVLCVQSEDFIIFKEPLV